MKVFNMFITAVCFIFLIKQITSFYELRFNEAKFLSLSNYHLKHTINPLASFEVIFQKRVRVFHRGFKHEKTDESTRPQAECFYCFRVFETR